MKQHLVANGHSSGTVACKLSVVVTNWQQAFGCAFESDGSAENLAGIDSVNPSGSGSRSVREGICG